jgi:hypothetical protein
LKVASQNESRNESFEHRRTKRIHETNLLKTRGFANPNPKDSDGFVYPIVLRIHKDSLDLLDSSNLWKIASQNESTKRIFGKLGHKTNPRNESFENCGTKQIHESNLLKTDKSKRNESMDSRNESTFLRISYTIPASLKLCNPFSNEFEKLLSVTYAYNHQHLMYRHRTKTK